MKTIEYMATYAEGNTRLITVQARNINAGFRKAAMIAAHADRLDEIHSVQFWMVRDA